MQFTPWYLKPDIWSTIGTCVAGASALAGFVVLIYYTIYTRRMMAANEAIARVTIEPLLILTRNVTDIGPSLVDFTIFNAGKGPALEACYLVSEDLDIVKQFGRFVEWRKGELATPLGVILPNKFCEKRAEFIPYSGPNGTLFVIQAQDVAGGIHQFQLLYRDDPKNADFRRVVKRQS